MWTDGSPSLGITSFGRDDSGESGFMSFCRDDVDEFGKYNSILLRRS